MDFEKKVPEWTAEGTEPPASLKAKGFETGYKPPASFFNWFWSGVSACLKEIREKLSGHADNKGNPHNVTATQLGLDKVNNTPDSEKSVKFASEAKTAREVEHGLTIRYNGGSTEGTDLFTYNGSTSRSLNLTPDKLSAAEKDLANVDNATFKSKASSAGVGIPIAAATSADGIAYTATVDGVTELYNGLIITIIPDVVSASNAPTLNVNGLGAKMVRLPLSFNNAAMTTPRLATYITADRPLTLQYDAEYLNDDGIWKVFGKQRTSAQDLYGTVPIEGGGTDATTAEEARENLGVPSIAEMQKRDRVVNKLINSDFLPGCVVNQRGNTSLKTNGTYIVDMWAIESANSRATVSVGESGITLEPTADNYCGIFQRFEKYEEMTGKAFTIGVCVAGAWSVASFTYGSIPSGGLALNNGLRVYVVSSNTALLIRNLAGEDPVTIQRVVLYEGSYTIDTLPEYLYKGYAAELAECQRYYENSWYPGNTNQQNQMQGFVANANLDAYVWFKQNKRITPTITLLPSQPDTYSAWAYYNAGAMKEASAQTTVMRCGQNGFMARLTAADGDTLTKGYSYLLEGHWEASADL